MDPTNPADRPSSPSGRYAPSPTGELHLGNGSSALLAWLSIRSRGGRFVLRVEDLDQGRARAHYAQQLLEDLAWLGIDWDEGPDCGGPHAPYDQWSTRERYEAAFSALRDAGRLYPCFCSRRDIAAAASAPQSEGDELRYSGTCRDLAPSAARRRIDNGDRHAWRFRVESGDCPVFEDRVHGLQGRAAAPPGDFVVYRADGVPAYQLAVVVDDARMRIDEVVRGDDLLPSTGRQLLLFEALGHRPPLFGHVPLLLGPDGVRLSKRHRGVTLRDLREEQRMSPEGVVGLLARLLGIRETAEPLAADRLVEGFCLSRVPRAPLGIRVVHNPDTKES